MRLIARPERRGDGALRRLAPGACRNLLRTFRPTRHHERRACDQRTPSFPVRAPAAAKERLDDRIRHGGALSAEMFLG
jgi:hypothetical protein